jgi:hypothetical protein
LEKKTQCGYGTAITDIAKKACAFDATLETTTETPLSFHKSYNSPFSPYRTLFARYPQCAITAFTKKAANSVLQMQCDRSLDKTMKMGRKDSIQP